MLRANLTALAVAALVIGSGCTARYSQSLAGRIPVDTGTRVRSSDSGFSLFGIAMSEPTSAHEQVISLMGGCSELTKVEVDYREIVFFIVGIPKVTITANCVR